MKQHFLLLLLAFACLLPCSGREKKEYVVHYDIRLDEVSCNKNTGYRQGITEQPFTDLEGNSCCRYRYEDDCISYVWYVSDIAFNFSLVNKLPAPMVVPWNSVSITNVDKVQSGVGYSLERTDQLMPSMVPGGTGLSGFVLPDINYPTGVEKDLATVLPTRFRSRMGARRTAEELKGKTMKVHVPMIIGGTRLNYWFTFVISGVTSITKRSTSSPEDAAADLTPRGLDDIAGNEQMQLLPQTLVDLNTTVSSSTSSLSKEEEDAKLLALQQYASHWHSFSRLCPQERVYLHLDNTAYFQGETVWYAAYVTDDTDESEPASKVLYVELISPTGVILKQHKLKIDNGRCHSAFKLVDTSVQEALNRRGAVNLPSGYYQIRAYTHSMLNFDDACVYSRVIPVYEVPKQEGRFNPPVMGEYPYHELFRPKPKKSKNTDDLTVNFFPEGGHLVSGVPCRVAFKVTDSHGLGVNIDALQTADGQEVAISPMHRGMGRFEWQTDKGGETMIVTVGGRQKRCTLPKAEEEGCALSLTQEGDNVRIHIDAVGMDTEENTLLAYTLTGRGRLCAFDTLRTYAQTDTLYFRQNGIPMRQVNRGVVSYDFSIPTHRCPEGVCQFTLYNPAGDILAQRLFFFGNGQKHIPVTWTATKAEYLPYERMQMTFRTVGAPGQTFSLAVRDAASYGTSYADDIRTSLLLSSELKGLIEHPEEYFLPGAEEALDLLMMVQGWTRYDWKKMAGITPFKVTHYTEQQLVLDGWAFSRILEKPLQNTRFNITLVSADRQYEQKASVFTDNEGYWSVGLEDFYGKWHFHYETEQEGKLRKQATTRVRLERSYKPALHPYAPIDTFLPDPSINNALLPVWREDISDFVQPHDAIMLDEVEIKAGVLYVDYGTFRVYDAAEACEEIFDKGDFTYTYGDYLSKIGFYQSAYGDSTELPNPRVHRYICQVDENGVGLGRSHRYMLREYDMEFIKSVMVYDSINDPRVLPCFKEYMRGMGLEEYMDLIYFIGRGDKFVIAEIVYGEPWFNQRRGKNERLATFMGYTRPVEFYAPTYPNGPVQGDKDYRRTLYWNPEVTTDSTGCATLSFYNNGYSRSLTVSAEGLTKDGIPIINERMNK
jgi:hypothetical protein